MSSSAAVIVGGGVIGLSAAWRAAQAGLAVTVIDPDPGHGASWVAAGMLAPVSEADFGEAALTRLHLAGADCWPSFADDLCDAADTDVGYRRCGTLVVAADPSDRVAIDRLLEYRQTLGFDTTRVSPSACRALVPALAPGICGGADVPGDHQVDNRLLVGALHTACERSGVRLLRRRVATVLADPGGRVHGVGCTDGTTVDAAAVVVAAGCESAALGGVPDGVLPPVRPVKGHLLRLRSATRAPVLERTVRGIVHGRSSYLVPRADGSLVVGATVEEQGFDRSVRAGPVHELLEDARALVPGIDELELEEALAGLRPGSPDNAPFIGWTGVRGLAVATGHYRNGILLAPLSADAIVALLTGAPGPPALLPFPADRHATTAPRAGRRAVV